MSLVFRNLKIFSWLHIVSILALPFDAFFVVPVLLLLFGPGITPGWYFPFYIFPLSMGAILCKSAFGICADCRTIPASVTLRCQYMAEKMWAYVKELIIKSSHIICYKIEPDIVLHILDITGNSIFDIDSFVAAKL
jgi:hypothetical protein